RRVALPAFEAFGSVGPSAIAPQNPAIRVAGNGARFMRLHRRGCVFAVVAAVLLAALPRASAEEAAPAKTPDAPTCDHAAFRVILDVGHTAEVPGAKSARGADEYDFNLRLAKLIQQQLTEAGFAKTTLLVTSGPTQRGLGQRVARA